MIYRIILGLIGILAQTYLYYFSKQDQFITICVPFFIGFLFYLHVVVESIESTNNLYFWIKIGFLIRIIGLFSFPNLSDDIYRYWWDGHLLTMGLNPFEYTPSELMAHVYLPFDKEQLSIIFPFLNSPNYYSVYPPFAQFTFSLGALIAGKNVFLFSFALKFILICVDGGIIYFLSRLLRILSLPAFMVICYFMHPLVMTEINGNVHLESFVVLFTLMAVYFVLKLEYLKSGVTLGFAVMTKLVPMLLVPLFLQWKHIKSNILFLIGLGAICLSFIPFLFTFYHHLMSSIKLFFVQFEFNSSFYSLIEHYFISLKAYEWQKLTSLILMVCFIMGTLVILIRHFILFRSQDFNINAAWILIFMYLICSSTVHPWYLIPLLAFGMFSYPMTSIVWSILSVLSYIKFDQTFFDQYSTLKWIEYLIALSIFMCELIYNNRNKKGAMTIAP